MRSKKKLNKKEQNKGEFPPTPSAPTPSRALQWQGSSSDETKLKIDQSETELFGVPKILILEGALSGMWFSIPKGPPSRTVFSTESDSVAFYYYVVILLRIVIRYSNYTVNQY